MVVDRIPLTQKNLNYDKEYQLFSLHKWEIKLIYSEHEVIY